MANYGYAPTGNPADVGFTGVLTSNLRGYRPDPIVGNGWGHTMKWRGGRRSGGANATTSLAVYGSDDSLFERTDSFTVATVMEDSVSGATYSEELRSCIKMRDGHVYPLAFLATVAGVGHGMIAASKISAIDEKFYFRNVSTQPPPDPAGWTSSATNGHIALWVEFEPNVAPDVVDSGLEPDIGETGVSAQPLFQGFFRDDNEVVGPFGVGQADVMSAYRIQSGPGHTGSSIDFDSNWVNASGSEKAARQFSYQYEGTPMAGERRWRCAVKDDFEEDSGWSDWFPFTAGGGSVTIPTPQPTGKQLTRQPSPFNFRWNHSGGLSTNAVRVRVKDGNTVIRESGIITKTVAPAANGSATWAETAFSDLPVGMDGSYSVQGRDTAGNWSGYSPDAAFSVNAAPSVPSQLWPDNETVNELPALLCYVTDADDVAASLTVEAEILSDLGVELFQRTMVHIGGNWFEYQLLPGDGLVSGTEYLWQAYSFDGTFFSGGNSGSAVRSPQASFAYSAAVAPQIVFPADNALINTTRPVYDWTFAGTQTKFRVYAWNPATNEEVYDSGIRTQGATYHTQPANYLSNGDVVRFQVTSWDALNVPTTSQPADFTVELDDVPEIAFIEASTHRVADDEVETGVLLSWAATTYEDTYFKKYIINRRADRDTMFDVDDPFGAKVHRVAEISDPAVTSWVDHPSFGVTWYYSVRQEIEVDGATYEGTSITAEVRIDFDGTVICDAAHCADKRAVLRGRGTRRIPRLRNSKWVAAWSEQKPTRFRTRFWAREVATEYEIYSEDPVKVEQTILDLDRMDIDGGPLIYRDARGKYLFGEIDEYEEIDEPGSAIRRVVLRFKQSAARLTGAT